MARVEVLPGTPSNRRVTPYSSTVRARVHRFLVGCGLTSSLQVLRSSLPTYICYTKNKMDRHPSFWKLEIARHEVMMLRTGTKKFYVRRFSIYRYISYSELVYTQTRVVIEWKLFSALRKGNSLVGLVQCWIVGLPHTVGINTKES